MATDRLLDLVCVSYLADAEVLLVESYPGANSGAVVDHIAASIAADGPLVAITAARLGLRVGLVANAVGTDPAGRRLLDCLDRLRIHHTIGAADDTATPRLTVVIDDADTRTWFASLQHAPAELRTANLHLLADARLIYVDCYEVLAASAARTIAAASGMPLVLNLGGDRLDDSIVAASCDQRLAAVQTSLDEADGGDAEAVATDLLDQLRPDAAVVTLGRLGALTRTRAGIHRAAAPPVAVTHTHGAGAAFSAGYAHALLNGAGIDGALRAGCEAGAPHCTDPVSAVPGHLPTTAFTVA